MIYLKMAKKSVDEESTAEYGFFYQLDWPPERVPPLIELVYFFNLRSRNRGLRTLDKHGVK
jgi:hypothetical protein